MGRLEELTRAHCEELLAHHEVGRVAWVDDEGPCVVPVNYVVDDDALWVRTSGYSRLGRSRVDRVALEIDGVDPVTRAGWSVLVTGRTTWVGPDDVPESVTALEAWAEGTRAAFCRIALDEVSGRRVRSSP